MARFTVSFAIIAAFLLAGCATDHPAGQQSALADRCTLPSGAPEPDATKQSARLENAMAAHEKLRAFSNSPLPKADTMVLIYFGRAHHETQLYSYVATRDPAGWWRLNRAGQTRSEFDTGPTAMPNQIENLPADKAAAIDALLADPCLYKEPSSFGEPVPPVGAWSTTITVITPNHVHVASIWGPPLPGLSGKLVTAVTGW